MSLWICTVVPYDLWHYVIMDMYASQWNHMTYGTMYASQWHHMTYVIMDMFTMDMYSGTI